MSEANTYECPFHGTCKGLKETCKSIKEECRLHRENERTFVLEIGELKKVVYAVESSSKSAHHRLDDMKEHTEAVIRLAVSVESIASQMEKVVTKIEQHDEDITIIKNQPAQQALKAYEWVKYSLAGGVIGLMFAYILWILTNKK